MPAPVESPKRLTRRWCNRIQAGALGVIIAAALIGLRFAGTVAAYACLCVLVALAVVFVAEYRSEP